MESVAWADQAKLHYCRTHNDFARPLAQVPLAIVETAVDRSPRNRDLTPRRMHVNTTL